MPVLISLVITVYNRERFLSAAIESILTQTQPDFELLIWDDGSTDRSVEIAQNYAQQDSRVRVVVAQHQGRSLALKDAIAFRQVRPTGVDSDFGKPNPPVSFSRREGGVRKLLPPMGKKFGRSLTPHQLTNRIIPSLAKTLSPFLAVLPLLGVITANPALSQVVSASDSAGTLINTTGNQFDITGGQASSNGANLFHSFSQFDLNTGQVANFQPNSTVQNILGRVVNGNSSSINGLIQVSGSQANLYLMNPAGIIFGSNASLNVPGSFVATTATSIGMGNNWFNASGTNDYTQLNDTPSGFAFTTSQPGSIVNSGNLTVNAGKDLMLLGGTVVSTGQVNAPAGQIKMAAVPGTSLVRLSQPGSVLSLEVLPPASGSNAPTQWTLPVLSLPQLLTGGGGGNATGLSVNAAGQAVLTGSGIQVPNEPGSAIASGSLNASGTASGQTGGTVHVLGNKVGLVSATIDASGAKGGGTVLIGGDYQGKGNVPNAARTYVSSDSTINADALTQGDGGRVIVWADEATRFYGTVTARGGLLSGNGGFAEVSGKAFLDFAGIANLSAAQGQIGTLLLDPTNITVVAGGNNPAELAANDQFADPGVNNTINNGTINAATANVILQATNDITFNAPINIAAFGVGLTAEANNNIFVNAGITTNQGNVTLNANADGVAEGRVEINQPIFTGGGNFIANGTSTSPDGPDIQPGIRVDALIDTEGGDITLTGSSTNFQGILINGTGDLIILNSGGGDITLNGTNNSAFWGIVTGGSINSEGGNITLTGSSIDFQGIRVDGPLNSEGGDIILTGSSTNIPGIVIDTGGPINSGGGNISLTGSTLNLDEPGIEIFEPLNSGGGNLTLTADRIDIGSGFGTPQLIGTGNLLLQPETPSLNLEIGGTGAPETTFLNADELGNVTNGFASITIGRADGSGVISLAGNVTFNDPLILRSPVGIGSINTTGFTLTGADNATITLLANQAITAGNINSVGDITMVADEIDLTGAVTGNGILSLQPFTISQTIQIGNAADSGLGVLDFLDTDLAALQGNFTNIIIGRTDGTGSVTLNNATIFNAPVTIAGGSELVVVGSNPNTIWNLTGTNQGNLNNNFPNNLTFNNIENLTGGAANDTFVFGDGVTFAGAIAGGSGINTLDYSAFTTPLTVNLATLGATNIAQVIGTTTAPSTLIGANTPNTWNITGTNSGNINSTFTFSAFSTLIGGNSDDTFTFNGGSVTLIDGGGGNNTLIGDNVLNTWNITGANSGNLNGITSFTAIGNFTGGNLDDVFQFSPGASISGNIDGQAGNLALIGDEINFAGNVSGTGNLILQPLTPNRGIQLGGTDSGNSNVLTLTTTELSLLQNGFNSITIGEANSSGTISILSPVTFFDPVTIQAPQGAGTINATGAITGLDNASITLKANQNITTSNITANPGITIISSNGTIDTSAGILDSSSTTANGGVISLSALSNITTNNITSHSDTGASGDITLNSQTGIINSGNLDASGNTRGGNITVIAREQITTGQLNSSAITGDGGNVLLDPIGDIQIDSINAQGGTSGKGGTVDITTNQFFRALGSFSDRNGINASISTAGGTGSGDIIIRHDGGARDIPFIVGDATINGTLGAITTGSANSILPLQSFPAAYTQGNIQLITQNPPPDTNQISKDIQGENLAPQGIHTISASAIVLLNTTDIVRQEIDQAISDGHIEKAIALVEQLRMQEFQNHFEGNLTSETNQSGSVEQTQAVLTDIATNTGKTPAVIYVFTQPDQLQLILVTPQDKPLLKTVYEANKDTLLKTAAKFRSGVTEPRSKTGYQAAAKQLYQWLVEPLEAELQARKIDTLVFSMDGGLRSIPMAALYDGKNFLVEKYSIGLIPSINLVDTRYGDVKTTEVLAMGASQFTEQNALPAVPIELSTIVGKQNLAAENRELIPANPSSSQGLWTGKSFLNQGFTLRNLKEQREKEPFGVIHLATHGEFNLGAPKNSYIQLSDTKLRLDELRKMGWNKPPVELLVLSACRTALGNEDAEFGFGGLAVAAGVKSAIASLWYVSDEGTLGLITEFYQQLRTAPIKAEALRQAQIAMIKGQIRIVKGQLQGIGQGSSIPLPPELAEIDNKEFSHPYYWSAFTIIGSPW